MHRKFCSAAAALRKRDPELADRVTRETSQALRRATEEMLSYLAMEGRQAATRRP